MPPKEYSQRSASWNKVRARTVRHSARRGQRNTVALPYPACCPSMALHDQLRAHSSLRRHRLQYGYHAGGQKSIASWSGFKRSLSLPKNSCLGRWTCSTRSRIVALRLAMASCLLAIPPLERLDRRDEFVHVFVVGVVASDAFRIHCIVPKTLQNAR